jgi:hypothetical protein
MCFVSTQKKQTSDNLGRDNIKKKKRKRRKREKLEVGRCVHKVSYFLLRPCLVGKPTFFPWNLAWITK